MLTAAETADLTEIHRLLDEAYQHYFAGSDGHCKSTEGYIEVAFGNYWDRAERGPRVTGVSVYSYVLGPNRQHWFDTTADALATVRAWHEREMATVYDKHGDPVQPAPTDQEKP